MRTDRYGSKERYSSWKHKRRKLKELCKDIYLGRFEGLAVGPVQTLNMGVDTSFLRWKFTTLIYVGLVEFMLKHLQK